MKKNSIKERAKKVPTEIKLMVGRSMAIAKQINRILAKQRKSQRDLADLLGKKESEISKWLRGTHNFTIKTISKIESVLGEQIILTSEQAVQNFFVIKVMVNDGKEQVLYIEKTDQKNYIAVESGKQYTISQSTSASSKANRISLPLSEPCFAN